MINNIISKSKEIIHKVWDDKRKRYITLLSIFTICFFAFNLGGLLKNVWTNLTGLSDYTEEVKSVVIKTDGYDDKNPGSYQITKSADWTSDTSAKITFDVDTNVKYEEKNLDIILVIDISGSMTGSRIEQVRIDTLDLVESALSTGNNRVALVEFATLSNIVSDFTTDSDLLLGELENLEVDTSIVEKEVTENGQTTIYRYQGVTNYYRALISVDEILSDYEYSADREVVVVFLTDGLPCYETPQEVGQYKLLKEKYPYITIQGIQYEMGYTVLDEVKNISDNQYIANMITLNDILFESVEAVEYYDSFEIVDYINNDYYYVESTDDIKVPFGSVTLTEEDGVQKITWTVPDNTFLTGTSATMEIDVKLQEQEENVTGYYPTNTKEEIKATLQNGSSINISSAETPVLRYGYTVTYDANLPSDCSTTYSYSEIQPAYRTVELADNTPSCKGYQFKGWKATTSVNYINDNVFKMNESDITFKATWTKLYLTKTQDGIVYENTCTIEYEVGDVITIGTESFNVISEDCETVTMLAQYNLGTNYRQSTTINGKSFSNSDGWSIGEDIDIQQYDGNVKTYVNEYISYLQGETGDNTLTGTLLTTSQLETLDCDMTEKSCANSKYVDWLVNGQSWWLRTSSRGTNYVDIMEKNGVFPGLIAYYGGTSTGIRPVITISKDSIPKPITFTIASSTYTAEEGMTWEEWVNSDYNTDSCVIDDYYGDLEVNCEPETSAHCRVTYSDGSDVRPTDILNSVEYFKQCSSPVESL